MTSNRYNEHSTTDTEHLGRAGAAHSHISNFWSLLGHNLKLTNPELQCPDTESSEKMSTFRGREEAEGRWRKKCCFL